jgi:hypothetical protein
MTNVIISLLVITATALIGFFVVTKKSVPQNSIITPTVVSVSPTQTLTQIQEPTATVTKPVVPLPQEEDIIRAFFNLVNEKRIPDAIGMMASKSVSDESSKQAWGVQFNSLSGIQVISIEASNKEEWTNTEHIYRVDLTLRVSADSANAPIPYYGWNDGQNTRWIPIEKNESGLWKIVGLATGP